MDRYAAAKPTRRSALTLSNARAIKTSDTTMRQVAGVSYAGASQGLGGAPSTFTVTMTAPAGPDLRFIIGDDGTGLVSGVFGALAVTFIQPTAVNGLSVPAFQRSFSANPVVVDLVNFQATTAGNLSQLFQYYKADINGAGAFVPVNLQQGLYPDQFINTRLVLNLGGDYVIDGRSAFALVVPGATSVTATFNVRAAIR